MFLFFFNATATTEIYTLSLHDALPIFWPRSVRRRERVRLRCASAARPEDRKSTRLNSSHMSISYAVFCLKKKKSHVHADTLLAVMLDVHHHTHFSSTDKWTTRVFISSR